MSELLSPARRAIAKFGWGRMARLVAWLVVGNCIYTAVLVLEPHATPIRRFGTVFFLACAFVITKEVL